MPKILHIMHAYVPATAYGGIVTWARDVCEKQAAIGASVSVVCMASNAGAGPAAEMYPLNEWQERGDRLRVKYYAESVADRLSRKMLSGLRDDIAAADVVHVHGIFYAFLPVALRLARHYGKPAVVTVHGMLSDWQLAQTTLPKLAFLETCVKPFVREVLWHATAPSEEADVLRLFPEASVRVVPNGVDIEAIAGAAGSANATTLRKRYLPMLDAQGPLVLAMGRLHRKKGLDRLLRAVALLREGPHPRLGLLIAGEDDGDGDTLRELVEELGLRDVVAFLGQVDGQTKWDLHAGADVFALPSHDENFGIVYAEALACGTPIVASVHTPWAIVEEDGSGRWISIEEDTVAEAIADLLERRTPEMRERCLRTARRFDWGAIVPQITSLYGV